MISKDKFVNLIREDNGCLLDLNPKNIDDIYVL